MRRPRFLPKPARQACALLIACALYASCAPALQASWFRRDTPPPGRTRLSEPVSTIQAQVICGYMIVTGRGDKNGPCHFIIDTGATTNLVTSGLARRLGTKDGGRTKEISVVSSEGENTLLKDIRLEELELGSVRFENVPALEYDCNDLSVHLGLRIDGILGFPLFKDLLLCLDYPRQRVILASPESAFALQPGCVLPMNTELRVPLISLGQGESRFLTLVDTGSDTQLRLNPSGMELPWKVTPRAGPIVASLTGDRRQTVGRLGADIRLGDYILHEPVVELLDEIPTLGAGLLSHFSVCFDQKHGSMTLLREDKKPLLSPPKRTIGLSFTKAGAYWRVAGVLPDSEAARAGIEQGDLVTHIDEEPVERWGAERFRTLVEQSKELTLSFLIGRRIYELKLPVTALVP